MRENFKKFTCYMKSILTNYKNNHKISKRLLSLSPGQLDLREVRRVASVVGPVDYFSLKGQAACNDNGQHLLVSTMF